MELWNIITMGETLADEELTGLLTDIGDHNVRDAIIAGAVDRRVTGEDMAFLAAGPANDAAAAGRANGLKRGVFDDPKTNTDPTRLHNASEALRRAICIMGDANTPPARMTGLLSTFAFLLWWEGDVEEAGLAALFARTIDSHDRLAGLVAFMIVQRLRPTDKPTFKEA